MDNYYSLNAIGSEALGINISNGFDVMYPDDWPDESNKIGCKLALIHSEVSEALEAVRHSDRDNFEEELADVIIRVLSLALGLGIDMDDVVRKKMDINKTRGYRHGGKAV